MTRVRVLAVASLVIAAAVVALTLFPGQDDYRVRAEFTNAGLLVVGGEVKVGGRTVGSISDIGLNPNGTASVELRLDRDEVRPLHAGARLTIRSLGAATITSRYVDVRPGSKLAPALPDGAVIPATQTAGIVDLDAVFDTFDAQTRRGLQRLFSQSAELYAGSSAQTYNRILQRSSPAFRELGRLSEDLDSDAADLSGTLRSAAKAADVVASQRPALRSAIASSARWTAAVAAERAALTDAVEGAPATLRSARRTLADGDDALHALRPTLRQVPPIARELRPFMAAARPTLSTAGPVIAKLAGQLPDAKRTLDAIPATARVLEPALRAAGQGLAAAGPIFRGLRIYGPDFVLGMTNGVAGIASSNYRASGHYARLSLIQNLQTTPGGLASSLLLGRPLVPNVLDVRTGLNARCAGGNAPPAPDGSNPYVPDPTLCDPAQSISAAVDSPTGAVSAPKSKQTASRTPRAPSTSSTEARAPSAGRVLRKLGHALLQLILRMGRRQ